MILKAIKHHQSGQLKEAEIIYRSILQKDSFHPDANHNMGVLSLQLHQPQKALSFFRTALKSNPNKVQFWLSLIDVLIRLDQSGEAREVLNKGKKKGLSGEDVDHLEMRISASGYDQNIRDFVSFFNEGRLKEAEQIANKMIELFPEKGFGWKALATILVRLGRSREALPVFEKACALVPNDPDLHNSRGKAFKDNGDFDSALESYHQALTLRPDYPEALNNLGNLYFIIDDHEQALQHLTRALQLKPDYIDALCNIGNVYQALGLLNEALESYQKVISLRDNFSDVYSKQGEVIRKKDVIKKATDKLTPVAKNDSRLADIYVNLGGVLKSLGRLDEALSSYNQALNICPGSARANCDMAVALQYCGRLDEAFQKCRKALELAPNNPSFYVNFATILKDLGQMEEAVKHFKRALHIDPLYIKAYYGLSALKKTKVNDPHFSEIENLLNSQTFTSEGLMYLYFTLGKMYADIKEYDQAFKYYALGNQNRKIHHKQQYKEVQYEQRLNTLTALFTQKFCHSVSSWGSRSQAPLFVIGMPRSGTTLVEQILSSHSQVYGAGELETVGKMVMDVLSSSSSNMLDWRRVGHLTVKKVRALADIYLNYINSLSTGEIFVVDKMPENFWHLWFIGLLFPHARVIHCVRNPLDTCLSCFFQNFVKDHAYSNELPSLAHYYGIYHRLMEHWQKVLPITIYRVVYENLVSDPEYQIGKLLDYCGLEFETNCLAFHKTDRAVRTASANQVRQKMYTSSVNKWKKYEKHLAPLRFSFFL